MEDVLAGKVKKGKGYGRTIGFPTLNIENNSNIKHGIYAGRVVLGKKIYKAGIVIGETAEAYLVGYRGNAYGKIATFKIKKFIRKFKKFKTEKELIEQIKKDVAKL